MNRCGHPMERNVLFQNSIMENLLSCNEIKFYNHEKLNNWELLVRYGFAINDVPQIFKIEIELDMIKRSCTGKFTYIYVLSGKQLGCTFGLELNNERDCLQILEAEWPFYNATRTIQMPLKVSLRKIRDHLIKCVQILIQGITMVTLVTTGKIE